MSSVEPGQRRTGRHSVGAIAVIAIGALFIGVAVHDLPLGTLDNPGPAAMPLLLAGLAIVFALWSLGAGTSGLLDAGDDDDAATDPSRMRHAFRVVAAMVLAAIAIGPLGYRLTILALLIVFLIVVERKPLIPSLLISFVLAFGSHALLQHVLKLQLPAGPWGL